ncbi:ABC transporter permease [Cohnella zeiphila]|uniref:Sugar ABC transporter permease n=1 Tax=Cohnella zeiphila TaxID=2761120 RepID=A0A7X0SQW2_9BACL|nr:ABC transporter permease subunit [Cohnella zeiphila]MBB6733275.1 sugar ABC transporter permease [Cohnella zeiphila]
MSTGSYIRRFWQLYAMLLLPVSFFALFKYGPMYGVTIAFKDYNIFQGIWQSPWNGTETFREIFDMQTFKTALRNTFLLNFLDLAVSFPAPIILALMLNEVRQMRVKRVFQTVMYFPHFISWVIIGGLFLQIFATNSGIINQMLNHAGFQSIPFLSNKYWWLATYLVAGVWQSVGWGTIIYLAALTGINKELYEAAETDGAGRMKRMWHITLPGIRPTILMLLILAIGEMPRIGFERPFVLGNSMVSDFSEVLSTFVYKIGLQTGEFSIATAVGLFQSVIALVFLLGANTITRKFADQSIV